MTRITVVGTSCAGKTTLARKLAGSLDCPSVELDALYWGPNWLPRPESEFRRSVDAATAGPSWVVDGNYRAVRDIVWSRATAIVWLNPVFATVLARAVRRTVRRSLSRESLYAGNRESLRGAFLSRESILLWVLRTYWERRRDYRALCDGGTYPDLHWIELRRRSEAATFLDNVRRAG